jgi:hypothetical protein
MDADASQPHDAVELRVSLQLVPIANNLKKRAIKAGAVDDAAAITLQLSR